MEQVDIPFKKRFLRGSELKFYGGCSAHAASYRGMVNPVNEINI